MATRKDLAAELMSIMENLNDRIFGAHKSYMGTTYVGQGSFEYVKKQCSLYRDEISAVEKKAEDYLALAPDMKNEFKHNVWKLNDAVNDFERSVRSVAHDTKLRNRELEDPMRPTGSFARRTGTNELTTVVENTVPIIRQVQSGFLGLSTAPIVIGHGKQTIVTKFDNSGRPISKSIYPIAHGK